MTLQQLKYVIGVVQCGSVSEAAQRLYVSQPCLSKAIKDLEQELGIRIFLRSSRGVTLTPEGQEFLSYARQVAEQVSLLEQRYSAPQPLKRAFALSTQHYAFAVNAFVDLIKTMGEHGYDCTLRETRTYDIIEDVARGHSELGILYLSSFNSAIIQKFIHQKGLRFHPLFEATPHVFISASHPLAQQESIRVEDLQPYPCLTFEQGTYNSFYFSEEILSALEHPKEIHVSDRATLFNLLIGLNGYTICTGILSADLNGTHIISRPLLHDETMTIGWIHPASSRPGQAAKLYLELLKRIIRAHGYSVLED